ncbi:MAG: hypothetical protein ACXVLT_05660, partial [Flavisolibacter sp.]
MKKQQPLSPRKYIETKARSLPFYKCWVNPEWKEAGMANVIVARQHVNQNLTVGIYLVDLMCLGVKDTLYYFNEPAESVVETLGVDELFIEIEYGLAHNIIYAGHDFALDYDIAPHKEFATTKYILEEDTDAIPLIDIATGDDEGKPRLIVDSNYNYKPVLEKLRKNAGEGNYTFIIGDPLDEEDEGDDFDEESFLDDIEYDHIDFDDVRAAADEDLEQAGDDEGEIHSLTDVEIIHSEQMFRILEEREAGWIKEQDEVMLTPEYVYYEGEIPLLTEEYEKNSQSTEDLLEEIRNAGENENTDVNDGDYVFQLFERYHQQELTGFILLNTMLPVSAIQHLEDLRKKRLDYPPLIQLYIAALSLSMQKTMFEQDFSYITEAVSVEDVFSPGYKLHSLHHKIFWVVKALHSMNHDKKQDF